MENVLKLTDDQLNVIGAGLVELPFKIAQPVIAAIHEQLAAAAKEVASGAKPAKAK